MTQGKYVKIRHYKGEFQKQMQDFFVPYLVYDQVISRNVAITSFGQALST